MPRHPDLLVCDHSALLVIDIQEKFIPVISDAESVIASVQKLIRAFQILSRPVWVTEQYPAGLGRTVNSLITLFDASFTPLEKMTFSCCGIPGFTGQLHALKIQQVIVCGIETHVCVWQTAMDLLAAGFEVITVNDAAASRKHGDHETAVAGMREAGIRIASTEMAVFELLKSAASPHFKAVQTLIK